MYDSTNASAIPRTAEVVAGYIDGKYAWSPAAWSAFPNSVHVAIAVFASTNDGEVLDCETGDATPAECPAWIRLRQAHGLAIPTIYCNKSSLLLVQQYCAGLTYDVWLADYTGVPHIPAGMAACQYDDQPARTGGDYDLSLCQPYWPRD